MTPVNLTARAREMRQKLTHAETVLWCTLRDRKFNGHKFRRQVWIGRFIVDFACLERMLIVELDGDQHGQARAYDEARTDWLAGCGYSVLRFTNRDVIENLEGVAGALLTALKRVDAAEVAKTPRR